MTFTETALAGAVLIDLSPSTDERGFFARTFCEREFGEHGLPTRFPQCSLSRNRRAYTLRGMHFAAPPYQESKLVRCARGAIYDVIIDLRPESATLGQWLGIELDEQSQRALFVPSGFAHGFLALRDDTDVLYMMGDSYVPAAASGLRWNDPAFKVKWPRAPAVISERDANYPAYAGAPGSARTA